MKKQFYSQKLSLKSGEISFNVKFKSWLIALMALLISLVSLNSNAQTITNVAISPTVFCPGSKVSISFTVTNGSGISNYFTSSTQYTIYLTNALGTNFGALFTSRSPSAPPPAADGGTAVMTFSNLTAPTASAIPASNAYRISISSDAPSIPVNSGTNVSAPFTVNAIPTISYSKVFASCQGNNGSINVTASGGASPYTYTWTGYPTASSYSGSTPAITNLPVGDYTIVVKDNNACTATVLGIAIRQAPPVSVGISENIPTCAGNDGSISAFRIGGVYDGINAIQYNINGGTYQTSGIFNGLTAGNYTVTAKDSKGCIGSVSVNLPADTRPAPSVGYQITEPGCADNDGTITAYRVGGVYDGIHPIQLNIDGGAYQTVDATSPLSLFSGLSAGTHTVTVKDSRGCTGSVAVTLTQAAPLIFTSNGYNINVSACGGGSDGAIVATVSGGVTAYTYTLSGGGVQQGVSSLQTFGFTGLLPNTAYTVTVTDSKGCSISKSVTLIQEPAPTAIASYLGNATCMGGNQGFITVGHTGGVPGYNYSDNDGTTWQSSYRFLNLFAGKYNIMVKDSKGCTSAQVPVTIADGTGSCTSGGRIGNITNSKSEDIGNISGESDNLTKSMLNSSLIINSYPNPFASGFTLDVKGNNQDKILITVTDVLGRRMYQEEGSANQQYKLGSNLKNGFYIVQVTQGSNIQTIKIVKE
ncbi:MAG TPA: T9SS type A sorting domain-containing protein [Hanamia sp.]|nr:T9SS type A sorting domain-containing protein [Hanamia sp.]